MSVGLTIVVVLDAPAVCCCTRRSLNSSCYISAHYLVFVVILVLLDVVVGAGVKLFNAGILAVVMLADAMVVYNAVNVLADVSLSWLLLLLL